MFYVTIQQFYIPYQIVFLWLSCLYTHHNTIFDQFYAILRDFPTSSFIKMYLIPSDLEICLRYFSSIQFFLQHNMRCEIVSNSINVLGWTFPWFCFLKITTEANKCCLRVQNSDLHICYPAFQLLSLNNLDTFLDTNRSSFSVSDTKWLGHLLRYQSWLGHLSRYQLFQLLSSRH